MNRIGIRECRSSNVFPGNSPTGNGCLFGAIKWRYVLVYIDDIFMLSTLLTDSIYLVKTVLKMIKYSVLALKLTKYHFFSDAIDQLGYINIHRMLQVDNKTKNSIIAPKCPMNRTRLK